MDTEQEIIKLNELILELSNNTATLALTLQQVTQRINERITKLEGENNDK